MAKASSAVNTRLDEQHVVGVRQAHDARQDPGEAELGREIVAAVGGGELGAGRSEAQVGESRQHQPHTGRRAVDGRDHWFATGRNDRRSWRRSAGRRRSPAGRCHRPCPDRSDPSRHAPPAHPGRRRRRRRSLGVAGDDDDPDLWVLVGLHQAPAVFGVHAPGPGVSPLRTRQGDGGDPIVDLVARRLQVHDRSPAQCADRPSVAPDAVQASQT